MELTAFEWLERLMAIESELAKLFAQASTDSVSPKLQVLILPQQKILEALKEILKDQSQKIKLVFGQGMDELVSGLGKFPMP